MSRRSPETIRVAGIIEPFRLHDRERRPVPGLEDRYEVTRTGRVWSAHKKDFMVEGQEVILQVENQTMYAKVAYLVALAWLTPQERQAIRSRAEAVGRSAWPKESEALALSYRVSKYAIRFVASMPESEFLPITVVHQRFAQVLPEPLRAQRP